MSLFRSSEPDCGCFVEHPKAVSVQVVHRDCPTDKFAATSSSRHSFAAVVLSGCSTLAASA